MPLLPNSISALTRRQAIAVVCTTPILVGPYAHAQKSKPLLADMHSHYGMFLPRLFGFDLKKHMQESGISLLAWAMVDDQRWIGGSKKGLEQSGTPQPGELWDYFQTRLRDYNGKLQLWGVQKALSANDIDGSLTGDARVVLASEAANFLEGDLSRLTVAHQAGVRHLQLVHYIQSPIGDHQTAEPRHGGLTGFGTQVLAECGRLGIVVDLAHSTAALVDAALDASSAAKVWSHSWVSPQGGTWQAPGWIARSLALPTARKIAAQGGVVGLWNLRLGSDPSYPVNSISSYADEIMRMCDLLGPTHVAFGTDLEGVWPGRLMTSYLDLRDVADKLVQRSLTESQLRDVFIGNYARVLKLAMNGATA